MKRYIVTLFIIIFCRSVCYGKLPKIVGLVQVRNEEETVEQCLRGLAVYTDAIVVLDDNSCDKTRSIVSRLAQELHVETIIEQPYSGWQKTTEAHNRQTLLEAGRAIGGTHFVLIDADELFMATCNQNNWLRKKILSLRSGQVLSFPMVNVWGSVHNYRDDALLSPYHGVWRKKPVVFHDDGRCSYVNQDTQGIGASKVLHECRVPRNLVCPLMKKQIIITSINHGIVHFKWACLDNIYCKKAWYMMLEYIRACQNSSDTVANARKIINYYDGWEFKGAMPDEKNVTLKPVPKEWYAYPFFHETGYMTVNRMRRKDIRQWINTYGLKYFSLFKFNMFILLNTPV